MKAPHVTGRCQCGACSYAIEGARPPVYACHCLECQRQAASAFSLSMPVARERFSVTGDLGQYSRPTDSGGTTHCFFCRACGSRLYHQSERTPDVLTVKAGTLDSTDTLVPVAHLWVSRKQPWIRLDPDTPCFETQPDALAAWRAGLLKESDLD